MLPQNLPGSYLRYKEDTDVVATWLGNSAKACGYQPPPPPPTSSSTQAEITNKTSARLKGRARKEAKAAVKPKPAELVLPTREIITQARVVANCRRPSIKMPVTVQRVWFRAIQARKRCSVYYKSKKNQGAAYENANASHEHFTGILESAFEVLKPSFESPEPRNHQPDPSSADSEAEVFNRFGMLNVEDPNNLELNDMASEVLLVPTKTVTKSKVYEMETDPEEELVFRLFCFFEDLQRISSFIKNTWEMVVSGEVHFLAASLTTNVAIELVREEEKALVALYPDKLKEMSWSTMTLVLFPNLTEADGNGKTIAFSDSLIYGETFVCIKRYMMHSDRSVQAGTSVINFRSFMLCLLKNQGTPSREMVKEWLENGVEEFPEEEMAAVPEPWKGEYLKLQGSQEAEDENSRDSLISRMVLAMELELGYRESDRRMRISAPNTAKLCDPYEDEVIKALESIFTEEKDIGVWVVFGIHTLIDILETTKPAGLDFYSELLSVGVAAQKALAIPLEGLIRGTAGTTPSSFFITPEIAASWGNKQGASDAVRLSLHTKFTIEENIGISWKKQILTSSMRTRPDKSSMKIYLPEDPFFMLTHNPVYCGMEILKTNVAMQRMGVNLADVMGSFLAVAHLYNAVDQLGYLGPNRWDAMDDAIKFHIKDLFNGATPTDAKSILTRFYLRCLGLTPDQLARRYRGKKPDAEKLVESQKLCISRSQLSILLTGYLSGFESAEKLLYKVDEESNKTRKRRSQPTQFELLLQLRDYASANMSATVSNLISLTRDCNDLLVRIRAELKTQLGVANEIEGVEIGGYYRRGNIVTVYDMFYAGLGTYRNNREGQSSKNPLITMLEDDDKKRLPVAVEVMNSFILEVKERSLVEPNAAVEVGEDPAIFGGTTGVGSYVTPFVEDGDDGDDSE